MMGKSLVIVESPAKAKTIGKYLGKGFVVKSSIGHIRDLPVSGTRGRNSVSASERTKAAAITRKLSKEEKAAQKEKKEQQQLIKKMGINPYDNWAANYEILPGKEKVVDELRYLAKQSDCVFLATDLDREGEAIAWHLMEAIGANVSKYQRVTFNEITESAIKEAFATPTTINLKRVNAQQARRFLDRIVGFMVSPLLWSKIARGLSAGRVQSVAVRLIVEREREIRKFVPEEYWEIAADTQTAEKEKLALEVVRHQGKTFKPNSKAAIDQAIFELEKANYKVKSCEEKTVQVRPNAPFITSTLQQAASTRLGFSVRKTMTMAQRLYEAGYITYMRTDSASLSSLAINSAREYIKKQIGNRYLPEKPNVYGSKAGAQEAHEAIRPTEACTLAKDLKNMERDAERLYELIWRQFIACQMVPAEYKNNVVTVTAGDYELRCKGRIVVFDGFTRIQPSTGSKSEDTILPGLRIDETLILQKLNPKQLFTKPPARFSEATLVKELEKRGIGRPSTYASIISTIQDRGYVSLKQRRFFAEKIGDIVTDRLMESFSDLMNYGFTAQMEENLDSIANASLNWIDLLDQFFGEFTEKLEKAKQADGGMQGNQPVLTDIECAKCQRPMQIRCGSTGVFLGCSGYNLSPKERCKETLNLIPGNEAISSNEEVLEELKALQSMHRCRLCGTAMESYLIDAKRKLHVCGNSPNCTGFEVEIGDYKIKGYEGPSFPCDKCGEDMQLKSGRFGKYFGCTGEECKNTRKLLRNGEPAPPKMDPVPMPELQCKNVDDSYVLRDGALGLFLAASQFPKKREIRAPLLSELLPHKDVIDKKYHYLFNGPTEDNDGNPSVVRFSKKLKQQYLMTESDDGKPTGWQVYYEKGEWVVKKATKKVSSRKKSITKKKATNV